MALLRLLVVGCIGVLCTACAIMPSEQYAARSRGSGDATSVQALLGASLYDDGLKFERPDPGDPNNKAVADLTQMPLLGVAGQYRLTGDRSLEAGLDGALIFNWWKDSATVTAVGGGAAVISVSTRLFMTDISFGGYAATVLNDWLRLYAGAGPLVIFASGRFGDETGSDSEDGFGVGGYVRAGAEFRIDQGSFLGFGVRALTSDINFGGRIEDVDADGLQVMLTYTQQF